MAQRAMDDASHRNSALDRHNIPHLLCLRNARAFPLLPAALASVPFGFVLVRIRVTARCAWYLDMKKRDIVRKNWINSALDRHNYGTLRLISWHEKKRCRSEKVEKLGIDPNTSRMLSARSTIWATSPYIVSSGKCKFKDSLKDIICFSCCVTGCALSVKSRDVVTTWRGGEMLNLEIGDPHICVWAENVNLKTP